VSERKKTKKKEELNRELVMAERRIYLMSPSGIPSMAMVAKRANNI